MQTQDEDSSIVDIGKDMDRILTVFGDLEQEERKFTNLYRRVDFHVLAATAEAERYIDENIAKHSIFFNKATRI